MKRAKKSSAVVSTIGSIAFCLAIVTLTGCATVMAAKQPDKKDLGVLDIGTPRTHVIAELGAPTWSEERDGKKVDIFAFKQGYSKGVKAGRALFHGAADLMTLGLWEVVGTPTEAALSGTDVKVEVSYDENNCVASKNFIQQEK